MVVGPNAKFAARVGGGDVGARGGEAGGCDGGRVRAVEETGGGGTAVWRGVESGWLKGCMLTGVWGSVAGGQADLTEDNELVSAVE